MTNMKKHSAAALTAAILTAALTVPALAAEVSAESIRVSGCKDSTLEVGERGGLIIGSMTIFAFVQTKRFPGGIIQEKSLKSCDFKDFWPEMGDSNSRPDGPKRLN